MKCSEGRLRREICRRQGGERGRDDYSKTFREFMITNASMISLYDEVTLKN